MPTVETLTGHAKGHPRRRDAFDAIGAQVLEPGLYTAGVTDAELPARNLQCVVRAEDARHAKRLVGAGSGRFDIHLFAGVAGTYLQICESELSQGLVPLVCSRGRETRLRQNFETDSRRCSQRPGSS
jgi:hypothetical protein